MPKGGNFMNPTPNIEKTKEKKATLSDMYF